MKVVSYFLFVAFVGAVLVCSFTGVSSHLGILSDSQQSTDSVAVASDPLRSAVPFSIDELSLALIMALVVGVFWPLSYNLFRLLTGISGFSHWQLRLQSIQIRLHDHLLTALRRGILQPNIY